MSFPKQIGPYRVVRFLGEGGMGVVLEVQDPAMPRRLALKLIREERADPVALERFWREAEVLAKVHHKNVVRVHNIGSGHEGPYLVMEYVEGTPLLDLCKERPLEPREAARIVRDLADALAAVHAMQILHRDLKPGNVILRPDGIPVLLDFGLVRDQNAERLTVTGMALGTLAYMSPEQAGGISTTELDARTDVYGLGAVLYELLTGHPPFQAPSMVEIMGQILHAEPTWPREERSAVPPELDAICRCAMAKDRDERYPSAVALGEDLERFLGGEATDAYGEPAGRWLKSLVGVVVLLALVLGGLLVWRERGGSGEIDSAVRQTQVTEKPAAPQPQPKPKLKPKPVVKPKPAPERLGAPGSIRWSAKGMPLAQIERVGPWIVGLGWRPAVAIDPSTGKQHSVPKGTAAAIWFRPSWDPVRKRILLADRRERLLGWTPGKRPVVLADVPGLASATPYNDRILIGTRDGRLQVREGRRARGSLWEVRLGLGRIDANPLALDLDGDGRHDHILVCTTAAQAALINGRGQRLSSLGLHGPVRHAPVLLAGQATGGSLPVLVASQDGTLTRLSVSARRIARSAFRTLDLPLATPPTVRFGSDGQAEQILVGTQPGWLVALSPTLNKVEWVDWDSSGKGSPTGSVQLVDLDRDGTDEVAATWFWSRGRPIHSTVRVYTSTGARVAELPAGQGEHRFRLARGERRVLIGCGQTTLRCWGPWTGLGAKAAPSLEHALASVAARAFVVGRREAGRLAAREAKLLGAMAAWHLGERRALGELLRQDSAFVQGQVGEWVRRLAKGGARRETLLRLVRPIGRNLNRRPAPPLQPLTPTRPPQGTELTVDLRPNPPVCSPAIKLHIAGGGFRAQDRKLTGLLLNGSGRLVARFRVKRGGRALLRLHHWSLSLHHQRGFAAVTLKVDGSQVAGPVGAPWWEKGGTETFSLGLLQPGEHTLEIAVSRRSVSLYSLVGFSIDLP